MDKIIQHFTALCRHLLKTADKLQELLRMDAYRMEKVRTRKEGLLAQRHKAKRNLSNPVRLSPFLYWGEMFAEHLAQVRHVIWLCIWLFSQSWAWRKPIPDKSFDPLQYPSHLIKWATPSQLESEPLLQKSRVVKKTKCRVTAWANFT